jgi:hypothetical protein
MCILKHFSVILVGLAATVCQAELAIAPPPLKEQLEHPSTPSGATPRESELKVAPLRLAIDLVDGSHIIGVPSITSVPVQTSFAKIDIPLEKIARIELKDDHETASVELQNGDMLKGVLNLKPIELETLFGKVSVEVQHATSIHVRTGPFGGRGLVLHYTFDRDEHDKVTDKSGKKHDGIVNGARWEVDQERGPVLVFDGVDDYAQVKEPPHFKNAVTVCGWFRINGRPPPGAGITYGVHRVGATDTWGWLLHPNFRDNKNIMQLYVSDGSKADSVGTGTALVSGTWYHIAGTYDGSSVRIYVNGTQDGENTNVSVDHINNVPSAFIEIGKDVRYDRGRFLKGSVGHIMVFNRGLSAVEIKQVYNSQK